MPQPIMIRPRKIEIPQSEEGWEGKVYLPPFLLNLRVPADKETSMPIELRPFFSALFEVEGDFRQVGAYYLWDMPTSYVIVYKRGDEYLLVFKQPDQINMLHGHFSTVEVDGNELQVASKRSYYKKHPNEAVVLTVFKRQGEKFQLNSALAYDGTAFMMVYPLFPNIGKLR